MFVVSRIRDAFTALACCRLTFPRYQAVLHDVPASPEVVAVVATEGGAPIGLGLSGLPRGHRRSVLLSLAVAAEHRRRGVAAALLQALEPPLRAAGAASLYAAYTTGLPSTPAVERLLQRAGFDPPRPCSLLCTADAQIVRAPVLGAALPAGATITPWHALDGGERARLGAELAAHGNIPPDVGPFCYEQNLLPECCFALHYNGRIIGWVLSQEVNPDTLCIVSIYVLPEYQGGAFYPGLQARLIETALDLGRKQATWTVSMRHAELVRYHRRYLLPYLARCDESHEAEKCWSLPQ